MYQKLYETHLPSLLGQPGHSLKEVHPEVADARTNLR